MLFMLFMLLLCVALHRSSIGDSDDGGPTKNWAAAARPCGGRRSRAARCGTGRKKWLCRDDSDCEGCEDGMVLHHNRLKQYSLLTRLCNEVVGGDYPLIPLPLPSTH